MYKMQKVEKLQALFPENSVYKEGEFIKLTNFKKLTVEDIEKLGTVSKNYEIKRSGKGLTILIK